MTATLSASAAILKRKYPEGRLPKAQYETFPFVASIPKEENWDGDDKVVAIQTENPQGVSADFATAQGSLKQGTYNRFLVSRVEHFALARIKGQALKAAQKNSGALVDLWQNETDGVVATEMKATEIYLVGDGSGVLGKVASGQGGLTITLSEPADIAKFDLGMRVGGVSDATLTPTARSGFGTITGIDRATGTITATTIWTTAITGLAANDYLVRAGDAASGGTGTVITGSKQWIAGGTTPGTLWTLQRNTDPVRLAGQQYDATGVPMEDAIMEAEARRNFQGQRDKLTGWCNTRNLVQLKKSLGGKVTYPRVNMDSTIAGISFKAVEFEGDFDTIKLMSSPFVSKTDLQLLAMDTFSLASLGPCPQLLNFDGPDFLRVATDDALEVRFGVYGNTTCRKPSSSIIVTNWGV